MASKGMAVGLEGAVCGHWDFQFIITLYLMILKGNSMKASKH